VLHLATQGGADALGKGAAIGSLDVGKEADLTVLDYGSLLPYPDRVQSDLSAEDILGLCIYRGGPHATLETFVRGQSVYRRVH
jgi:cytosine/adenosine deaminase-related metal-dependent hydrolase